MRFRVLGSYITQSLQRWLSKVIASAVGIRPGISWHL